MLDSDHYCERLEKLFAGNFRESHNTILCGGASEPLYQPAHRNNQLHVLYYRENYPASALHEISHWCLAGEARRLLTDFGYWYQPDGRTDQQQREFERVEVKPQALEWMFSEAAGLRFSVSADNLSGGIGASRLFVDAVSKQAQYWCEKPLPARADQFLQGLVAEFRVLSADTIFNVERYLSPSSVCGLDAFAEAEA